MWSRYLLILWPVIVAFTDAVDDTCTEYFEVATNKKQCSQSAITCTQDPVLDNVLWYRCVGLQSSSNQACQVHQRQAITATNATSGSTFVDTVEGLCFMEFSDQYTGFYCFQIADSSTCTAVLFQVKEHPVLNIVVKNVTVISGGAAVRNTAVLQCNRPIEGRPMPSVTWRYAGITLRNSSHYSIVTSSSITKLMINNVTVNDNGRYVCQVETIADDVTTKELCLTVSGAVAQVVNASLGSTIQLTCNNHLGNNPNPQFQWEHNGGRIMSDEKYQIAANGSLAVFNLISSDFGLYYCWLLSSPYGSAVTIMSLQQTDAASGTNISGPVSLLIHHQHNNNCSHVLHTINQTQWFLQSYLRRTCPNCSDVITIATKLLIPCQCNESTSLYKFRLSGTRAIAAYQSLINTTGPIVASDDDGIIVNVCNGNCCGMLDVGTRDNSGSGDGNSDLELALTITMATLITLLVTVLIIILLSYHWHRRNARAQSCDKNKVERIGIVTSPPVNPHVSSGPYDHLNHHQAPENYLNLNGATDAEYESM